MPRVVRRVVDRGPPAGHGGEMLETECRVQAADAGAACREILIEREAGAVDALAAVVAVRVPEVEQRLSEPVLVLLAQRIVEPSGRIVLVERFRELEQRRAELR